MTDEGQRDCSNMFVYRRPYVDAWGKLHDPTTTWDELLKYYKPWFRAIQVGEGTRRMARRPVLAAAQSIIAEGQRHHRQNMRKSEELEATDLRRVGNSKQWKRRQAEKEAKSHRTISG